MKIAIATTVAARNWRQWMACSLLGAFLLLALSAAGQAAELSLSDINRLMAAKHNHQALQAITRLLALTPDKLAQQQIGRYDLLMMQGQALLNIYENANARTAYLAAAKAAATPSEACKARATAELIAASRGRQYVSASGAKFPYISSSLRPAAFAAFYKDVWASLSKRLNAAKASHEIVPSVELLPDLRTAIDVAASLQSSSATKQPGEALTSIAAHMTQLITSALKAMQAKAWSISRSANQRITRTVNHRRQSYRRGLSRSEMAELETIARTCDEIAAPVHQFVVTFPDFPKQVAALNATLKTSQKIYHSAETALQAR
ncbi:MAG: hypothetical protein HKL96_06510 [Phycisphaerales bacterium]|nr:hypothetical protein [Phycisphaerales bacterium]